MTSEEKRDKREARRQVEAALYPVMRRNLCLFTSPGQQRAALKTMVDRFYREQVAPAAKRIEAQVLQGAKEREAASA